MGHTSISITEEEAALIRQSLILPIVLDVLEHDVGVLQRSSAKMNAIYVRYLYALQDQVSLSLFQLRRRMKLQEIKVVDQRRGKEGLKVSVLCRGYEHNSTLLWPVVRSEIELVLGALTSRDANSRRKPVYAQAGAKYARAD